MLQPPAAIRERIYMSGRSCQGHYLDMGARGGNKSARVEAVLGESDRVLVRGPSVEVF